MFGTLKELGKKLHIYRDAHRNFNFIVWYVGIELLWILNLMIGILGIQILIEKEYVI